MSTTTDQLADKRQQLLEGRQQEDVKRQTDAASPTKRTGSKLRLLAEAAGRAKHVSRVTLPGLSAAFGEHVEVDLQTISVQTLIASGLMPGGARKVIKSMIERSEELTKSNRDAVGMQDLVNRISEEDFNGDDVEVATGVAQILQALAVLGAKDFYCDGEPNYPPITLTLDPNDNTRLWIGKLPQGDVEILSGQLWQNLEGDASVAEPFPGKGDATNPLRAVEPIRPQAERSDRPSDI